MPNKLLYVDLQGSKSLPDSAALRVAARGYEFIAVTDPRAAYAAIESAKNLAVVVSNVADLRIFAAAHDKFPKVKNILLTEETMDQYSKALEGKDSQLLSHIIANRFPQSEWTIHELRATLQKLLTRDIFGIEKYLAPTSQLVELEVKRSDDREYLNNQVMRYADQKGLSQHIGKLAFGITEELLMNAIYDAPVHGGKHRYGHLPRTVPVNLEPNEYAKLSFGCDDIVFAIAVQDPFGSLSRDTVFSYLRKVLRRNDSATLIDEKKGGAGLGLFKILYSCHSMVCNVTPGKTTEVLALIDIRQQLRDFSKMARSIHFFQV